MKRINDPRLNPRAVVRSGPFQSSERAAEVHKIKPPSRWRNKWFSLAPIKNVDTGELVGPGEFVTSTTYPTAEYAEQKARENIATWPPLAMASIGLRYLGPVPAGDA